jgi:hypothetical protein
LSAAALDRWVVPHLHHLNPLRWAPPVLRVKSWTIRLVEVALDAIRLGNQVFFAGKEIFIN